MGLNLIEWPNFFTGDNSYSLIHLKTSSALKISSKWLLLEQSLSLVKVLSSPLNQCLSGVGNPASVDQGMFVVTISSHVA